jgi:hypothetical protein
LFEITNNLLSQQLRSPPIDPSLRQRQPSTLGMPLKPGERGAVHENIASVDLQNPSDALEILAQVADRADDGDSVGSDQNQGQGQGPGKQIRATPRRQGPSPPTQDGSIKYKPVQDGMISPEMVYHLFSTLVFDQSDFIPS